MAHNNPDVDAALVVILNQEITVVRSLVENTITDVDAILQSMQVSRLALGNTTVIKECGGADAVKLSDETKQCISEGIAAVNENLGQLRSIVNSVQVDLAVRISQDTYDRYLADNARVTELCTEVCNDAVLRSRILTVLVERTKL